MRCRMRCGDIWRCGGPIKKYVPVDSIGIEGRTQEMTFDSQVPPYSMTYSISISPSDATKKDVRIESNNPSIISVDSVESGQVTFTIHSEGEARIRITSLADADISDEYGVTITAPSQQFSPNNGIFVDVDTEGTATGRKRKTKATAMGDRFTARVFILNEESEDYVLLEWIHGGDVSKTYVGAANEAHTRAMFTEETTDKLVRTIETLWDDGQIANGFVKFTDETWGVIEQFYSTPLTSESIEELQETLAEEEIVTLPETYFDGIEVSCENQPDISGGAGSSKKIEWRGTPDTPGTHDPIMFEIGDESIVSITDVQIQPEDEQHSEQYLGMINFLKKGETTITFYSVNNPRGTNTVAPVTVIPQPYTMTINIENLPEGADITGEITDPETGEDLEEISASYFPMAIEFFGGLGLNCNSHEGDGDIDITSLTENLDGLKQYQINIACDGYKPLFETVGFDLEDGGEGNYYCDMGPGSNVSMTISFTPIEESESYTITVETEAMPEGTVINYGINETGIEEATESDFPMTFDFSEPISLSYQSDVFWCGALLDNGSYQFWGTYEDNSVHIEMNGEPLSNGDEITIDSDTTLKFVWDPPAPERCPASLVSVWGDDSTISIGETTAVVTNFTTTAECENVDYSNIVAYVRASYNVPSDVATASIDFNENKVYVTGVKAGECTVVFTDGDRSWSNNVTVTAPTPPAYATISSGSENITMAPGDNVVKWITYSPSDANTSNITLTDSDGNVAHGSYQHLEGGECHTLIDALGEGTCTVTVSDGTNSYVYNVTVVGAEPESYTMTINVENLPEGADITGEIMDGETGEQLGEISVSSFPMTIDVWTIDLAGNSHEGDGDININSFKEEGAGKNYQINIICDGYKPLFEAVGFDFNDAGDGAYAGVIEAINLDSDVSLTISFTPIEESESYTFTINVENAPDSASFDNGEEPLEVSNFPIILDIPSGGSFNGACNSHEGDGDLNVTIYDTPDGSSEGVGSDVNISCEGYMPLFETVGFDLEDGGDGSYSFKKDDNYQIIPDSNVSMTISFTPIEEPESHTFTINVENLPEGAFIDNGEEPLDFPIILDIPSGGSFNGNCDSHEGDGNLNVTIYDTPDGSSEGVWNVFNIGCDGYKPSFEAVGFDLEDVGDGSYNFKKDDDYQIAPDSDVSMTISFTPVE